jgi:hypothetical protein
MKDPNKFKNAIMEKTKQAMDGTSRKSTSTSLDKVRPQNQVGQRIHQTQSPPPKFKQDPNIPDKYSIFDKWVEFRDKYLAGNVNEGFRKAGYTGKFLFNSVINSNMANNLKQKATDEASNLKNKAKSGELFSFSDKKDNQYADTTSSGSWKDTLKEKFGQSADVAKEKFGQGAEFAREKAQEAYVYGKEVGKEQLSKGAEVAKDKLGQGAEIAKEKLGQGAEFAKGKAQEAYVYGKEVGSEQLSKGAGFAKEKLGQGAEVAKEKLGQGAEVAKEKLGQGAQVVKDKLHEEYAQRSSSFKDQAENISNYSKESLRSATENVSKTASSAYDSAKSIPINATNKIYKFGKRTAILVFAGATVVAFAFAAGRQLPIAYFNYQLKKQQMEGQNDRLDESPIKTERKNNAQ